MTLINKLIYFVQKYLGAFLSALLVLLLTGFSYLEAQKITRERNTQIFENRASQVRVAINRRMHHYIQILKGAKSFYVSSDSVTRTDWFNLISNLQAQKSYPGIQGVGFAPYLRRRQLPALTQRIRKEGFLNFKINPDISQPVYTPIIYLEPFTGRNLRVFGYDMFSEARRRKAILKAINTGEPAITSKIKLGQETDEDVQYGFLLYIPIYRTELQSGQSITNRRDLARGVVYAPFRIRDLMRAILKQDFRDVTITLYDGSRVSKDNIFYSNAGGSTKQNQTGEYYQKLPLTIAGHNWLLEVKANHFFHAQEGSDRPLFILLSGTTISLLVFFIGLILSRNRYTNELKQLITDHVSAAIFIVDDKNRCTFMNPAAEKMTGYSFAELKGKSMHDAVHYKHPDGSPYPLQECTLANAVLKKSPLGSLQEWFIRKDGTFYPVVCSVSSVLPGTNGTSVIIEVRDITEERNARLAIEESETRFRIMADSAPVMIYVNDPEGNCQYLNKHWVAFTGQPLEEGQGRGWLAMVHPDDVKEMGKVYYRAFENKAPFELEYRLKTKQGAYAQILTAAVPRFNTAGIFQGYIGSIVDITSIKEAERQIRESAELQQKVFYNVPAVVGLIRASDRRYILANPKMYELHGNRQLVGLTIREAHPDLEGQGLFELVDNVISTGQPFIGQDVLVTIDQKGDGNSFSGYYNLIYQPLFDGEGQVETILVFAVDVTELVNSRKVMREINDELKLKNEQLLRINNDLDNFVYTASHDLRAPIANLEGLIKALKGNLSASLNADGTMLMEYIGETVNKLKRTINDLTDISKVQKGIQEAPEPLAFEQILQDVQEDIKTLIEDSGAQIFSDFEAPEIKYERKNLRSILYNLLSNAIKYRHPERVPVVIIKTRQTTTGIELTIQDNGLGIEKSKLHKLFAMFQRLHSHVEGSGIGLYIVKRIIENKGGTISLQSEPGKGTTFTVVFPNVEPAVKEVATITL